jgi:hypothetical protein
VPLVGQVLVLAWLATLSQLFDFMTALQMVGQHGLKAELNPLVRSAFLGLGAPGVAILKLAPVLLIVLLVKIGFQRPRLARNLLVVAAVTGSLAALSNVSAV